MAIAELDQVIWANLEVSTGGVSVAYVYGDLLPAASTAADVANRALLLSAGAVRRVVSATTAEDLATAYATAAAVVTAREASETGTALASTPVIPVPGTTPVVENVT